MIRLYESKDAGEVADLFTETIHKISSAYYSPDEIEAWAPASRASDACWDEDLSSRFTAVYVVDNEIVGFGCLDETGDTIDRLFTHHAHQSEGIGSALLTALEAEAIRRGHTATFLTTSATAWHFYLKRGYQYFKSEKRKYGNIVFDCQILRKLLPAL